MEEVSKVLSILIVVAGIAGAIMIILHIYPLLSDAIETLKKRKNSKINHGIVVEKNSYMKHEKTVWELVIIGRKNNKIVKHRIQVWCWTYFNYNVGDYYPKNKSIH